VNDSTLVTTFANLNTDRSAGMEFIISGDVRDCLSINFSVDAFYHTIDATNLGYSNQKAALSWNTKLATNLHFTANNIIQINAYYRSAQLTPQGERLPSFLLNLGVRQDMFHQKASLTLTISDVLKSLKWQRTIDTPALLEKATSSRNSQIVYFGFAYRFGESGKKEKEEFKFDDAIK
jgi:hypothetical protein